LPRLRLMLKGTRLSALFSERWCEPRPAGAAGRAWGVVQGAGWPRRVRLRRKVAALQCVVPGHACGCMRARAAAVAGRPSPPPQWLLRTQRKPFPLTSLIDGDAGSACMGVRQRRQRDGVSAEQEGGRGAAQRASMAAASALQFLAAVTECADFCACKVRFSLL
jgi:hypothetical protein